MRVKPFAVLSADQINKGKQLSIFDGLATEVMTTLTGGTLLTAMAIYAGASNFQIGILAALPSFTNVFQLLAIWMVFKCRNRKAVALVSGFLARVPLILIGIFPFIFSTGTSVEIMIFLLAFHYFFGSLAGPGWNSWMKDLIPQQELGIYFSHRGRMIQIASVTLGMLMGLSLDWVKSEHPSMLIYMHAAMFIIGGLSGLLGTYFICRTPEPQMVASQASMFTLMKTPLMDKNFLKLLLFQGIWSFAIGLAVPFYTVYILKTIELPLSFLIGFNMLTNLSSIGAIKFWGRLSDRIGNKSILFICAPIYALTILAWPILSIANSKPHLFWMLAIIHVLTGIATSGINLSLGNIGLKLADKEAAVAYIVLRGMAMALVSTAAPVLAGIIAVNVQTMIMLFIISGICGILSLRLLSNVEEQGATQFPVVWKRLRQRIFAS